MTANEYRILSGDKNILKLGNSDCCTALQIY